MKGLTILLILAVLLVAGSIMSFSIDSEQIDELCTQDGSYLYRAAGIWTCGSANTGVVADGTGGWTNTTTQTQTNLNVNVTGDITMNQGKKICMNQPCTMFICSNSTSLLVSANSSISCSN